MKIYTLEEISNLFNELVSAIEDGCREHQFLVIKAAALSLMIIIDKHLREHPVSNMANSGIKNNDIGGENSYFLNHSYYISR
jgi:hypothetical protein